MKERAGEKIGWIAGWTGGFIWVLILSVVFLFQGKFAQGLMGMFLTIAAVVIIIFFTPWRFPSTPYWKIMLAPYGIFFLSIFWALWSYGGFKLSGLSWWSLFLLFPILMPFGSMSKKKWADDSTRQSAPADSAEPRR